MTIRMMLNILFENLEYAQSQDWVERPFAYALYQSWKIVNLYEGDHKNGKHKST